MERLQCILKSFIQFWCDKHGVPTFSFSEWEGAMISAIDEKISHLSTKVTKGKCKNTLKLKNGITTKELKMLRNKFVNLLVMLFFCLPKAPCSSFDQ